MRVYIRQARDCLYTQAVAARQEEERADVQPVTAFQYSVLRDCPAHLSEDLVFKAGHAVARVALTSLLAPPAHQDLGTGACVAQLASTAWHGQS